MSFLRLQRLTLGLIAFLAVGWAQTFGLHRGWVCDCGGVEQITQADHCHGPHSEACHEDNEDHSAPSHPDDEEGGERHRHAAMIDALVAKQQNDSGITISAPVKLIAMNDRWEHVPVAVNHGAVFVERPPSRSWRGKEWPRRLAQSIALRI